MSAWHRGRLKGESGISPTTFVFWCTRFCCWHRAALSSTSCSAWSETLWVSLWNPTCGVSQPHPNPASGWDLRLHHFPNLLPEEGITPEGFCLHAAYGSPSMCTCVNSSYTGLLGKYLNMELLHIWGHGGHKWAVSTLHMHDLLLSMSQRII